MDEQFAICTEPISGADWERTPSSVKRLVKGLSERIERLEQQLEELRWENQQFRIENQEPNRSKLRGMRSRFRSKAHIYQALKEAAYQPA
jgi:regulator of replication initiation timing